MEGCALVSEPRSSLGGVGLALKSYRSRSLSYPFISVSHCQGKGKTRWRATGSRHLCRGCWKSYLRGCCEKKKKKKLGGGKEFRVVFGACSVLFRSVLFCSVLFYLVSSGERKRNGSGQRVLLKLIVIVRFKGLVGEWSQWLRFR